LEHTVAADNQIGINVHLAKLKIVFFSNFDFKRKGVFLKRKQDDLIEKFDLKSASLDVEKIEERNNLEDPPNCIGTWGTIGTLGSCFGTAGTYGCCG
jgi:hypothetical protein